MVRDEWGSWCPAAHFLTRRQDSDVIITALSKLRESTGGKEGWRCRWFLTDDRATEQRAVRETWPGLAEGCQVTGHLLCSWHFEQTLRRRFKASHPALRHLLTVLKTSRTWPPSKMMSSVIDVFLPRPSISRFGEGHGLNQAEDHDAGAVGDRVPDRGVGHARESTGALAQEHPLGQPRVQVGVPAVVPKHRGVVVVVLRVDVHLVRVHLLGQVEHLSHGGEAESLPVRGRGLRRVVHRVHDHSRSRRRAS